MDKSHKYFAEWTKSSYKIVNTMILSTERSRRQNYTMMIRIRPPIVSGGWRLTGKDYERTDENISFLDSSTG